MRAEMEALQVVASRCDNQMSGTEAASTDAGAAAASAANVESALQTKGNISSDAILFAARVEAKDSGFVLASDQLGRVHTQFEVQSCSAADTDQQRHGLQNLHQHQYNVRSRLSSTRSQSAAHDGFDCQLTGCASATHPRDLQHQQSFTDNIQNAGCQVGQYCDSYQFHPYVATSSCNTRYQHQHSYNQPSVSVKNGAEATRNQYNLIGNTRSELSVHNNANRFNVSSQYNYQASEGAQRLQHYYCPPGNHIGRYEQAYNDDSSSNQTACYYTGSNRSQYYDHAHDYPFAAPAYNNQQTQCHAYGTNYPKQLQQQQQQQQSAYTSCNSLIPQLGPCQPASQQQQQQQQSQVYSAYSSAEEHYCSPQTFIVAHTLRRPQADQPSQSETQARLNIGRATCHEQQQEQQQFYPEKKLTDPITEKIADSSAHPEQKPSNLRAQPARVASQTSSEQRAAPNSVAQSRGKPPNTGDKVTSGMISASTDNKTESQQARPQRINHCNICGRNYARPSTLKTHLRTHTNERPYKCKICGKTFSQAANLTAHQRVHTGERPFSCPICRRPFSQSSSVITHLRTHSGERPYKCDLCSRTFSDSSTLTKHCRIHSGEKPYRCSYCPLNFSQSGNLSRHIKLHLTGSLIKERVIDSAGFAKNTSNTSNSNGSLIKSVTGVNKARDQLNNDDRSIHATLGTSTSPGSSTQSSISGSTRST